jgi:ammonium transporter, Amt family
MHLFPFLRLSCDEDTQINGVDDKEMGEFAYDYVAVERESPAANEDQNDPAAQHPPDHIPMQNM